MQLQTVKISKLKSNTGQIEGLPKNPRLIRDEKYAKLKKSIEDDPEMLELREVIAYDNGGELVVICGNMRLRALSDLGYTETPVKILPQETSAEKLRAYTIKDNLPYGQDDWELLTSDWDAHELSDWGLDLPGFDIAPEAEEDDFEVPEGGIETDIVLGDLFEIGEHRLLCGDSTDSDSVTRLMGGGIADMYITDPPYGVSYVGKTKQNLTIKNDRMSSDQTHDLWRDVFNTALTILKDGAPIYATVPPGLLQVGFMQVMVDSETLHQCMVWNKGQMVLGHADYHYQHEPILYGWKPGAKRYFTSDRTKTTVFDFKKPLRNADHPTMKPVELWAEMIGNSSNNGDVIYDSFLGSGTTMVACHQLNRKCYGMELDPKYCQVIVNRMLKLDPNIEIKKNGEIYKPSDMN